MVSKEIFLNTMYKDGRVYLYIFRNNINNLPDTLRPEAGDCTVIISPGDIPCGTQTFKSRNENIIS